MKLHTIFLLAGLLALAACGNDKADPAAAPTEEKAEAPTVTRESLQEAIETHRTALTGVVDVRDNRPEAMKLVTAYEKYAKNFQSDEKTPMYLFMAGDLALQLSKHNHAINLFDRVLTGYKDHERAPDALFMKAMIYDQHLDQKGRAQALYQQVIDDFPDHQLAKDAASILPTLNMSDKELIEMLKSKEKEQS